MATTPAIDNGIKNSLAKYNPLISKDKKNNFLNIECIEVNIIQKILKLIKLDISKIQT